MPVFILGKIPRYPRLTAQATTLLGSWAAEGSELSYLGTFEEPEWEITDIGSVITVTRIADESETGFADNYSIRHNYSTLPSWNCDESVLKLGSGTTTRFLDGSTFALLPFTYPTGGFATHWSYSINNRAYGTYGSTILYRQDANFSAFTLGSEVTVRDFSGDGYTEMQIGSAHNVMSLNDVMVLRGRKAANSNTWVVIYDLLGDSILYEHELDWVDFNEVYSGTNGYRWAKVSPDGDYLVIAYSTNGSGNNQGVWSYPIDDVTVLAGGQLHTDRGHGDVGYDAFGNQVYTQFEDYDTPSPFTYSLVTRRLDTQAITSLDLPLAINPEWGHVSFRGFKRAGNVFVSFQGTDTDAGNGNAAQLFASVRLDNTQRWKIMGRTRTDASTYDFEPHGCPSPRLNRYVFASDWDGNIISASVGTAHVGSVIHKRRVL